LEQLVSLAVSIRPALLVAANLRYERRWLDSF
jgi:hypothetical protein